MIIKTLTTTEDNEIAAEARSQWRSFAIEGAVRRQLQEEGVKREEAGDLVRDLMRDNEFLAAFSKVSLFCSWRIGVWDIDRKD